MRKKAKKKYSAPKIKEVKLLPAEGVLSACRGDTPAIARNSGKCESDAGCKNNVINLGGT